jgi:hypothetical protein
MLSDFSMRVLSLIGYIVEADLVREFNMLVNVTFSGKFESIMGA